MLVIKCKAGEVIQVGDDTDILVCRLLGRRVELVIARGTAAALRRPPKVCRSRDLVQVGPDVQCHVGRISATKVDLVFSAPVEIRIARRTALARSTPSKKEVAA